MSENANVQWLAERVAYLRQLKAPSEPQRLLMMLAEKPDRSPADDRNLAVLIRVEKADERLAKLRGLAAKVVSEEKAATRKARNHRLIQQGLLFDLVGLESRDPAELAGALAALAELDDPARWAQWKTKGQAVLARKTEAAAKAK
ncbi:MAG: conjugal transfer protein TraD [Candidatus Competibacter sp.]